MNEQCLLTSWSLKAPEALLSLIMYIKMTISNKISTPSVYFPVFLRKWYVRNENPSQLDVWTPGVEQTWGGIISSMVDL